MPHCSGSAWKFGKGVKQTFTVWWRAFAWVFWEGGKIPYQCSAVGWLGNSEKGVICSAVAVVGLGNSEKRRDLQCSGSGRAWKFRKGVICSVVAVVGLGNSEKGVICSAVAVAGLGNSERA